MRQHKGAGPVCAFGRARRGDPVTVERCLLVTGYRQDRQRIVEPGGISQSEFVAAGTDVCQQRARNRLPVAEMLVPSACSQIPQHCAGGVGRVGCVALAAGEIGQQPGIDGAANEVAGLGKFPGSGDVVKQPGEPGAGEVRVGREPGAMADLISVCLLKRRSGL